MRKIIVLVITLTSCFQLAAQEPNLLSGKYDKAALKAILIPQANWRPFPLITDRAGWAKADQGMMKANLAEAEKYLDYQWPAIPATKSLLIERTGDRNQYQAISFEKRNVLGTLLLAEIYENKGRFIDPIINGVWSICEESFWGVPAHLPKTKALSGLIDVSAPFVDLFSAETGTFLSWVDYYLGEKLDAVSPQIRKRIYLETNNRIFTPLMTKPHGWMAANASGRRPNNWNPWICSNWLNTALLLEKDDDKRAAMVHTLLNVLDQFTNPYPNDGGCDEGPGYWGAAAASLYDNIAMLNLATNQSFQFVYDDEKIKNMGRFIYRAQISDTYFVNFADASPKPGMAANMIYRFGKDIGDTDMMKFGAFYRDREKRTMGGFHYFRNFYSLFMQEEYQQAAQGLPLPENVWLPDLQVMMARDKEGSTKGFYVAAKGGHNDESHNHNDIGNYVVYYDGLPLLIDVGSGTYTAKTFSGKRYDIWYNCSDYHNVPTINGKTQSPGSAFKAANVRYQKGKDFAEMQLDIASAYPSETGVKNWLRTIRLNKNKNVTISDGIAFTTPGKFTQHLMTCYPAEVNKPGELVIHYKTAAGVVKDFVVKYNAKQVSPTIEKIPLTAMEDKGVLDRWGDNIYRVNFTVTEPISSGNLKWVIAAK